MRLALGVLVLAVVVAVFSLATTHGLRLSLFLQLQRLHGIVVHAQPHVAEPLTDDPEPGNELLERSTAEISTGMNSHGSKMPG